MAYAYTLCASIIFTGVANVLLLRRTQLQLREMAAYDALVSVRRGGAWRRINCRQLVPGDVIRLEEGRVPCDAALVSGRPAVDESMLTGESLPVTKTPLPSAEPGVAYDCTRHKRHTVFAGTSVLTATDAAPVAVVVKTGLSTQKGQLLQTLMFPAPLELSYEAQVRIILGALLLYSLVTFGVTVYFFKARRCGAGQPLFARPALTRRTRLAPASQSASLSVSVMFGLESIATVIPPLLPLALAVGQTVASDRLRRKAVFCLSLPRIALAGMVDVMCFDKTGATLAALGCTCHRALTLNVSSAPPLPPPPSPPPRAGRRSGTLTREGLDFAGTHPMNTGPAGGSPHVAALVADASALPPLLCAAMACATSLSRLGTRLVGNEVDCKLFSATGWELEERAAHAEPASMLTDATPSVLLRSSCGSQRLEVLRRFEFDHGLQCMSAVARDVAAPAPAGASFDAHIFVKGSYERMRALASPGCVPPDYDAVTAALAKQGAYVLALGHRLAPGIAADEWRGWTRADAERDLQLLGLLVFRNELKADTPGALAALIAGGVACTMITGDNAFTGCCIARAAGLLDASAPVALAEERRDDDGDDDGRDALLVWRDVDSGRRIPEAALLEQLRGGRGASPDGGWCELALTGGAFGVLLRAGSAEATSLLRHARVLARMSPDQKTAAVDVLKAAGLTVGMCGDGGNDCGALRAAHVGIALSEAEASLVSPFASKRRTIAAVVDVLLEGRASLATGFASLKYMVQYGLLYSILNLCVNFYQGSLSQAQYIFIDMAIILPLSAVSTLAGPARTLHARRPPTDLLGPHTLLSLLGQLALCAAFTGGALALLQREPWYVRRPPTLADPSRWWLAPDSAEVSVLFLTAVHQFSASAVAFSLGSVFRAGAHTNWSQCLAFAGLQALFAALVLSSGGPAARWFHLVPLPAAFRVRLWLLLQLQTLVLLAWQKVLLDGPLASWGRAVWDRLSAYKRPSYLRLPALAAFMPPADE
jgi:cation-transporting ATPase 13A3/4/5